MSKEDYNTLFCANNNKVISGKADNSIIPESGTIEIRPLRVSTVVAIVILGRKKESTSVGVSGRAGTPGGANSGTGTIVDANSKGGTSFGASNRVDTPGGARSFAFTSSTATTSSTDTIVDTRPKEGNNEVISGKADILIDIGIVQKYMKTINEISDIGNKNKIIELRNNILSKGILKNGDADIDLFLKEDENNLTIIGKCNKVNPTLTFIRSSNPLGSRNSVDTPGRDSIYDGTPGGARSFAFTSSTVSPSGGINSVASSEGGTPFGASNRVDTGSAANSIGGSNGTSSSPEEDSALFDSPDEIKENSQVKKVFSSLRKLKSKVKMKFYNQVTVDVDLSNTEKINTKIFKNGSLQMTGCKSLNSAKLAANIIIKSLYNTKGKLKIPLRREFGLLTSKLDKIYRRDGVYFGFYENEKRSRNIINHYRKLMIFDEETSIFIQCFCNLYGFNSETSPEGSKVFVYQWIHFSKDLIKKIYNSEGKLIVFQKVIFYPEFEEYAKLEYINKNNILYSKNKNNKRVKFIIEETPINDDEDPRPEGGNHNRLIIPHLRIYTKQGHRVGVVTSTFIDPENQDLELSLTSREGEQCVVESYYSAVYGTTLTSPPQTLVITDMKVGMINSDYKINYRIDRYKLVKLIRDKYNLICTFDITNYPGVKIRIFFNSMGNIGCNCYTVNNSTYCSCTRASVMCFKTGNIIITAAKTMVQVDKIYKFMNEIFSKNIELICE